MFEPDRWQSRARLSSARRCGVRRARFVRQSVSSLGNALTQLGSTLYTAHGAAHKLVSFIVVFARPSAAQAQTQTDEFFVIVEFERFRH